MALLIIIPIITEKQLKYDMDNIISKHVHEDILLWTMLPIKPIVEYLANKDLENNVYYTNNILYQNLANKRYYTSKNLKNYINKTINKEYCNIKLIYKERLDNMMMLNKDITKNINFIKSKPILLLEKYINNKIKNSKKNDKYLDYFKIDQIIICDECKKENYIIVKFAGRGEYYYTNKWWIQGISLMLKENNEWIIGYCKFNHVKEYSDNNTLYPDIICFKKQKLILSMIVKNEADRYLTRVLSSAAKYVDEAVIIDDASEDNTVVECKRILKNIPITVIEKDKSQFHEEFKLRKQQWNKTVDKKPEWILNLDADEQLEDRIIKEKVWMINHPYFHGYLFKLYDFWDEDNYRQDEYWNPSYKLFLVRYEEFSEYKWKQTNQHCGRFPCNVCKGMALFSSLRVKHFGWMKLKDRINKFERYKRLDPYGQYGIIEQYQSILDSNPNLVLWDEKL